MTTTSLEQSEMCFTAIVLQQLVYAVTTKMDKSSLKSNSLCQVLRHNLRHSERIWREIRQNEVFTAPPLKVQQRKELFLISIASSTRLSEPYSGKNLFLCLPI